MGTSGTTGQSYYSGDWTDIKNLAKTLKIGEGKITKINQELVEFYQEMIDRQIDGVLNELYHVPLLQFNQVQPDGTTKSLFPGEITYLARMWTTGMLVLAEFQGLDPNTTEQATQMTEEARRRMYNLVRFNFRLQGQEIKSNISKTFPPSFQMGTLPESDV